MSQCNVLCKHSDVLGPRNVSITTSLLWVGRLGTRLSFPLVGGAAGYKTSIVYSVCSIECLPCMSHPGKFMIIAIVPSVSDQGYELLHSLHTPDGIPMDEDAKYVHFHDFSEVRIYVEERIW